MVLSRVPVITASADDPVSSSGESQWVPHPSQRSAAAASAMTHCAKRHPKPLDSPTMRTSSGRAGQRVKPARVTFRGADARTPQGVCVARAELLPQAGGASRHEHEGRGERVEQGRHRSGARLADGAGVRSQLLQRRERAALRSGQGRRHSRAGDPRAHHRGRSSAPARRSRRVGEGSRARALARARGSRGERRDRARRPVDGGVFLALRREASLLLGRSCASASSATIASSRGWRAV